MSKVIAVEVVNNEAKLGSDKLVEAVAIYLRNYFGGIVRKDGLGNVYYYNGACADDAALYQDLVDRAVQ